MTEDEAKAVAIKMDESLDAFFAANKEDKVKILKHYLDAQIGSEAQAEIKSVPGMPFLSGAILEGMSDAMLDTVSAFVVKKFFSNGD